MAALRGCPDCGPCGGVRRAKDLGQPAAKRGHLDGRLKPLVNNAAVAVVTPPRPPAAVCDNATIRGGGTSGEAATGEPRVVGLGPHRLVVGAAHEDTAPVRWRKRWAGEPALTDLAAILCGVGDVLFGHRLILRRSHRCEQQRSQHPGGQEGLERHHHGRLGG